MGEESNEIRKKLFPSEVFDSYKDREKYQDHLLDQYTIYQESAENISSRRQAANSFFVTINTVLVALVSYLQLGSSSSAEYYWLVALAGVAISYMWYRLIRSYRDLNSAKYKVIHEIEKKLPLSPFDAEWEAVGRGKNPALYLPFTHIEMAIPWVFLTLHLVAFWQSFPWGILTVS